MIIDAHAHVYAFPKIEPEESATIFMSMQDQIALMDAKGIDKAVILPLNNPESGGECQSIGEILYICEKYPGRFIPFCNVDPRLPRRPDKIRVEDFRYLLTQYRALGCKGLGEITARIYWDDPCLMKLFAACEGIGFPVTFHTITPDYDGYGLMDDIGFSRFERILEQYPNLKFFGHSPAFWSEISGEVTIDEKNEYAKGPVKPGGKLPELMRKYSNLYGDVSAGSGLNAFKRDPVYAYEFIDEFQDRLLLGLDACSLNDDHQHIEWLKLSVNKKHISKGTYEKIMWKNINHILNLGIE